MRLIARFAQEYATYFEIITVFDREVIKEKVDKEKAFLFTISHDYPAAVWFERKITDDYGIEIRYTMDTRPLLNYKHAAPMLKSYVKKRASLLPKTQPQDEEDGLLLGPTHPYHLDSFQFQIFEENNEIFDFELMPFFKYRGVEKMVEGLSLTEAKPIVERISGSTSIAYQMAYLDIQLQASKKVLPTIIKQKHMFLLEFERVINHIYDLAVMCQFIDFPDASSFLMKLLEIARGVMEDLTGHRFGFSSISENSSFKNVDESYSTLFYLEKQFNWFQNWLKRKPTLGEKLLQQGMVKKEDAKLYGLVGIMARSSGIESDWRQKNKLYKESNFHIAKEEVGDTSSRFKIRITEIYTSFRIMKKLLNHQEFPFFLGTATDGQYYSYVESSAGELMMYVSLKDGKIEALHHLP